MPAAHSETVLFVTHDRYFGGSAVSLRTVLRGLTGSVRRALAAPDGRVASELTAEGLVDERLMIRWDTKRLDRQVATTAAGSVRIAAWGLRRRRQVTAVHANGLADVALAAPVAALCRVPLVVWVHDAGSTIRRARHLVPIARRFGTRVHLAAVSRAEADALVAS